MWCLGRVCRTPRFFLWAKVPAPTRTHKACRLWAAVASCWTITWKRLTLTAAKIFILPILLSAARQKTATLPRKNPPPASRLRMQFRLLRPKIVVCLGRIAAQQMIGKDFSVTRDHGKFFDKQGTLFMATLHPAALLRNPKSKISAFEDFVALREKIEQVCDHTYNRS